jgi:cellulose biosynthesis protein BcsQ
MTQKQGRIITFYSYKGGTGRTMALSNIAWVLASTGYDVLIIDWDIEAPGLHRYLRPFLIDRELVATAGLIDFVWDCAQTSITPKGGKTVDETFPSLEDYAVGLDWDFGERGSISFIPAGRQDDNYAQRANTFNWDNFYERLGGGKILEQERARLRTNYDYILIDSRTGVSDTASICTLHMPDILLVFFTLNRQSINGTAAVARSIHAQRPDISVFPVPTRIENSETDKRDAALAYSRHVFAPLLLHVQTDRSKIDPQQQAQYWNQVETPYRPFYAFEEVPAAFKDEPGGRNNVLAPCERVASWISGSTVNRHHPVNESRRSQVISAFSFTASGNTFAEWASAHPETASEISAADVVDAGTSATVESRRAQDAPAKVAPRAEPAPAASGDKVKSPQLLWKIVAAASAMAALILGIQWQSTANQLEMNRRQLDDSRQLVAREAAQLSQFRQTTTDSLDRLADAAVKLDKASKDARIVNIRQYIDDAKDTVSTVRRQLGSLP